MKPKNCLSSCPTSILLILFFSSSLKLGGNEGLTVGLGREVGAGFGFGGGAASRATKPVFSMAFTKGAFVSVSLEGGFITPRRKLNNSFYGAKVTPGDIIAGKVSFPPDKKTLWPDVQKKLAIFGEGQTSSNIDAEEKQRVEEARVAADAASQTVQAEEDDVVQVHAENEAANESNKESS